MNMSESQMSDARVKGLSMSAVSNLIGVPAPTIRTWERRYDIVEPARDESGRRVYSPEQVERLRVIAELSDLGERVSDLARMSTDELQERHRLHRGEAGDPDQFRVAVVHPTLGETLTGHTGDASHRVDVVARADEPDQLEVEGPIDVLVVDLESLGASPVVALQTLLDRLDPPCTLVTYHYMARPVRNRLTRPSLRAVKVPLSPAQLRQLVVDHALAHGAGTESGEASDHAPATRFRREELEKLIHRPTGLLCECPNHIASLVLALREFELYSRRCANETAEDAALHGDLADGTGQARATMEVLLARVCAHEGIDL